MTTITVQVQIPPSRELRVVLPADVPIGRCTVALIIDAPDEGPLNARPPLDLPVHDFGPWPARDSLRREELYGDDGR